MFKKNPEKPTFLWATDEETPLTADIGSLIVQTIFACLAPQ